jgi:hypothetical protein
MGEALRRLGRLVEHAMSDLAIKLASDLANCAVHAKRLDLMTSYFGEVRSRERERCIAAMVASQPEGMRAVMEQRYREIMEAGK